MNFSNLLNTVILLGTLQGIITSCMLFFSKKGKPANRFLGILVFLIALASLNLYGNYVNWFNSGLLAFITQVIPMVIVMPLGPLLYFYVKFFIYPEYKIEKRFLYHFYSIIIDLIPTLVILIYFTGSYYGLIRANPEPWGSFIDDYNVYADIPRWLSLTIYIFLASKYLSINVEVNSIPQSNLNWIKSFIKVFMVFQLIWLVYLIPYVIPIYTDKVLNTLGWYPVYIPLAILIYWLGIKGYIVAHNENSSLRKLGDIKSLVSPEELYQITISLKASMELKKIFLDPTLNLNALAKHTGYSSKIISVVLNQHFQKSFNEYINEYRVTEFKARVLLPEYNHFTITGLALECGFNSQATFQRAFKELTGLSPSQFRKRLVCENE